MEPRVVRMSRAKRARAPREPQTHRCEFRRCLKPSRLENLKSGHLGARGSEDVSSETSLST
eukprot:9084772-Pyramimonas_sp.AAC.1